MLNRSSANLSRRISAPVAVLAAVLVFVPQLADAGALSGSVLDGSGTFPLAGAQVVLLGRDRQQATDPGGRFRFPKLAAGTYEVRISHPGTQTETHTVTVPTEGSVTLNTQLRLVDGFTMEMVVIGQRALQANALAKQRNSDIVASFLTRDVIGQFPDQNVSEAVRRLPGVSVQNDQGEGRFIVLRGLDPNLNAASLNGVRVTAPESDVRAVALDVVPAELVQTIEVQKSLIPEMDGDAIGGAIDIRTPSAFDRRGNFLSITGAGSYNDNVEEWSPRLGVDASTIINDRLGLSVGLSYFDRELGSDNIEAEDWTDEDGIVYSESMELRDYEITRERIGATVGVDYYLTENTRLFGRGVYSSFEDEEFRARTSFDFGDAVPVSGDDGSALFELSGDEEIGIERDIKDRKETQEIYSLVLGGETLAGPWTFNYEGAYSYAEEDESNSFDPTAFERDFGADELIILQSRSRSDEPRLTIDPSTLDDFIDASTYEFESVEAVDGLAEDEEYSFKLDLARQFDLASGQLELKAGGRGRFREKSYDLDTGIYDGYDGPGEFLLSDVEAAVDYDLNPINPTASPGATRRRLGDLSEFELNEAESLFESAGAEFEVDEDILAGYLQGRYESGRWRVIGGVRVEATDNDMSGNRVDFVEEGGTFEGTPVAEDTTFVTPVSFNNSYTDVLPSATVRFEAREDVILRLSGYRSIFRPNIEDLAPRFIVEQSGEDEREGEFGNPDLDPYTAWNIELGTEWYFAENAVLQGSVFYKNIDDFIVRVRQEDFEFNGIFFDEGIFPVNGDSADVTGIELNYQHALTSLPAPFDGLLVGANYTYVDSEGSFGDRDIDLPATSENVLNLVLGYDKGPISVRLAYVYRDEYLDEVSEDGESDRIVDEHGQLDLTARYRITPKSQIFVEAINITDEPFVAYQRTPAFGDRLMQYEEYSFTLNIGARITF